MTQAPKKDGKFLVRTRGGHPGDYVLSVTFRGKPTHHLVQPGPNGNLLINKKAVGSFTTIQELVQGLQDPAKLPPSWPVPLAFPVAAAGAPAENPAPAAPAAAPAPAPAAAPAEQPVYAAVKKPGVRTHVTKKKKKKKKKRRKKKKTKKRKNEKTNR